MEEYEERLLAFINWCSDSSQNHLVPKFLDIPEELMEHLHKKLEIKGYIGRDHSIN